MGQGQRSSEMHSFCACIRQALVGLSEEREAAWAVAGHTSALRANGRSDEERRARQDAVHPCYVARNPVMQAAIAEAKAGNYQEARPALMRACAPAPDALAVQAAVLLRGMRVMPRAFWMVRRLNEAVRVPDGRLRSSRERRSSGWQTPKQVRMGMELLSCSSLWYY